MPTTPSNPSNPATSAQPPQQGTLAINGIRYHYEMRGHGEPLLLLHGGLGTSEMFDAQLPILADGRRVILVDLQGHGRTSLGDRPFNLLDQGDDMAELIKQLGFSQVDVMGYSLGAGVAFRLAVQHPAAVRRLVLVSLCFSTEGFYPELLPLQAQVGSAMAPMMKDTPMYKAYVKVAPNPEEFPRLLDRLGEYMRKSYNWADDVKKVQAPTMLVYGDSDMFRPEHIVQFYQLLGGGLKDAGWMREHQSKNRLAILPDLTHYDMLMSPALATTVRPFLDGKAHVKSWAEQVSNK
ncbi:MAG TPA: alpha/beta hydrolase [Kofleriaceae bacterium]|nr:alpha/beta hydrolase [Kofleriaceae bacterium]